ncbi:MAG: hypothetical protein ACD_72C00544G0002 [uncultured bacterium]|nr:MAG: hypothetical protein ACD_72C00544G0002 [uncultured bacterium]
MSEEKKSFFASLDSKSALIVGLVAGVLVICTIGFVVMLGLYFKGGKLASVNTPAGTVANNTPANVQQPAPQPVSVVKADRPKVELFIMSYCPYGLQMQKAYLPAWELLKNKADIDIKFVSYAMHGKKEIDENTRQYCIEQNQPAKYQAYAKCFTGKDDYKGCLSAAGISESSLTSCINATNNKFGILDKFNDQSTWLSGRYPIYSVHQDLNDKYGVEGSPTLVINGAQAEGVGRTAEAVKQAICASFNNAPAECQQTLSNSAYQPGFGYDAAAATNAAANCAT